MDVHQIAMKLFKERLQTDNEALLQDIAARTDLVCFRKGTTLVREGDVLKDCYCLVDGVIRIFYLFDGEEITESLVSEQGTVIYPSVFLNKNDTANATIALLTDCTLLHMSAEDLYDVMRIHPDYVNLQLQLVLRFVDTVFRMKREMTHMNPTERYLWFAKTRPDLVENVPQKYIASYLGMTPVSLSRIRGKLREQNAPEE